MWLILPALPGWDLSGFQQPQVENGYDLGQCRSRGGGREGMETKRTKDGDGRGTGPRLLAPRGPKLQVGHRWGLKRLPGDCQREPPVERTSILCHSSV